MFSPTMKMSEFAERRKKLMAQMGTNTLGIIAAAPERIRNGDGEYPYRQDSDFHYLTGYPEPEAIAVLIPGRAEGEYILFNRPRDPAQETWTGRRAGQLGAVEKYGANQAYPFAEFAAKLPEFLLGRERIAYCIGRQFEFDQQIINAINTLHSKTRMGVVAPREFINLEQWLHAMRLIKSSEEAALMRHAAKISAKAHTRAMQACRPGQYEYQLEAELLHEFYLNGSRSPAYNSIVGSGENSCILHYNENTAQMKDGDLVLIDAGCEYEYYSSDITRTFPVNGRFTPEQRTIYDLVLASQLAGIAQAKPGSSLNEIYLSCLIILVEGLVRLGILQGKVSDLIQQKAYFPYFMHRTGHWLGLDTHDAGRYKEGDDWTILKPGMVLTIEPGLYFPAHIPGLDKKWWNIGVRIEDDVLITPTGCEILSADVPKNIDEIEELMASNK